jgi:hypothetical protein
VQVAWPKCEPEASERINQRRPVRVLSHASPRVSQRSARAERSAAKTGLERRRSRSASSLWARSTGAICRAASRSVVSTFIFNGRPPNKRVLLRSHHLCTVQTIRAAPAQCLILRCIAPTRDPSISAPWRQQAISSGVLCAMLAPKSVETAHIHLHNFRCRISSGIWASQIFRVRNRRTNRPEYRQSFRS